ncbi:MAG: PAS domain S-box protein [candidate division FCPU426 bacterium]
MQEILLSQLLDRIFIQNLIDACYRTTGMPLQVLDARDGSVFASAGMPTSDRNGSGRHLMAAELRPQVAALESIRYECRQGIWEAELPLMVRDRLLAVVHSGGFVMKDSAFLDTPDAFSGPPNQLPLFDSQTADAALECHRTVARLLVRMAENDRPPTAPAQTKAAESARPDQESLLHLRYFENMDHINRIIQQTSDPEQMMRDLLDAVLAIFNCDRAFLVYPCEPTATTWTSPMERTRPEYPGVLQLGLEVPMDPEVLRVYRTVRATPDPVTFGPGSELPLPQGTTEQFHILSMMSMAVYPKNDQPYMFGIHQCSYARVWNEEEKRLMRGIGERLGDSLTSMQAYRHLQESEQRYREIFENITNAVVLYEASPEGRFKILDVNPTGERILGLRRTVLVGKYLDEMEGEVFRSQFEKNRLCLKGKAPISYDRQIDTATGQWHIYTTLLPMADAAGVIRRIMEINRDITEQTRAEKSLRRLNRELHAISNCIQVLMRAEDEDILLNDICRIICEEAGYRLAWVGYAEPDAGKTIRPKAWAGFEDGYLATVRPNWSEDSERGRGPSGIAVRSGEKCFIQDITTDARMAPWKENAVKRGYHSIIALPLKDETNAPFGVLVIYSGETDAFTGDEVRLLEELAADLAFGICSLRARERLKHAEREQLAHLRYFECMDQINHAIRQASDVEKMVGEVLDMLLANFDCDRAFLIYPCDPEADSWSVPIERTRPEYPGANALQAVVPMTAETQTLLRIVRSEDGPVAFGQDSLHPLPPITSKRFNIQSLVAMAVYPKQDKPYMFGLHQCSYPRVWSEEEKWLLRGIGERLGDALTSLQAHHQLQESERRYREIFENTTNAVMLYEVTPEGRLRVLDINPAFQQITGYKSEDLDGRYMDEFGCDTHYREFLEKNRVCLESKTPVSYQHQLKTPTGEWHFQTTLVPVSNAAGSIYRIVNISRNITEQILAEAALRDSEQRLSEIFNFLPDATFAIDRQGRVIAWNKAIEEMTGVKAEQMLGKSNHEYALPFYGARRPILIDLVLLPDEIVEKNYTFVKREGGALVAEADVPINGKEARHLWGKAVPLYDIHGQLTGAVEAIRDITEKKRWEEVILNSKIFLDSLVEQSPYSMWIADDQGTMLRMNPACRELLQIKDDETVGKYNLLRDNIVEQQGLMPLVRSVFEQGESIRFELTYDSAQLKHISLAKTVQVVLEVTIFPIRNSSGKTTNIVVQHIDISARKRAEAEREALIKDLETKNAELERFTYTVSHDLKNPLISIKGFSSLLEKLAKDTRRAEIEDYAGRISRAADQMRKLLNDLLELSRAGHAMNVLEEFSLDEMAKSLVEALHNRFQDQNVEVVFATPLPVVKGDPLRLREVLENLLDNALAYMGDQPKPKIELGMCYNDDRQVIYVQDNGMGVEPKYHQKIFGLFERLDADNPKGTGVGLAIVKRIVELHGGRVWVESEGVGRGSRFCFTLPH